MRPTAVLPEPTGPPIPTVKLRTFQSLRTTDLNLNNNTKKVVIVATHLALCSANLSRNLKDPGEVMCSCVWPC